MKKPDWKILFMFAVLIGLMNGCASIPPTVPASTHTPISTETSIPTSTPEDTATPAPTSTVTPIPIPGIDEPIVVNEISVQVLEAKWEEPQVVTGFQLKAGYRSLMLTFKLQSKKKNSPADLLNGIEFRQMRMVDDQENESPVIFFNLPISSLTGSEYAELDLFFAVLESTTPTAIRFVDGQVIDLAPLLSE